MELLNSTTTTTIYYVCIYYTYLHNTKTHHTTLFKKNKRKNHLHKKHTFKYKYTFLMYTMAQAHILIPDNLKDQLQQLNVNISQECRDFLQNLVIKSSNDVNSLTISIKKSELKQLEQEISVLTSKASNLRNDILVYEKMQEENKTKDLIAEKDKLDKQKFCHFCSEVVLNDPQNLRDNSVAHRRCLFSNYEKAKKEDLI